MQKGKGGVSTVVSFSDWNPSHFLDCAEMTHVVASVIGCSTLESRTKKILQDAIVQKGLNPALEVYDKEAVGIREILIGTRSVMAVFL